MATFYSDIGAKQLTQDVKSPNDPILVYGGLAYVEAVVTLESGVASSDIVNLVQVPANFRLIPHLSSVESNDITDSAGVATIDIGDDDDTVAVDSDRYADGLDVAGAGKDLFDANSCAQRLTPYTVRKTSWIQLKFATLVSPTVGQKLVVRMVFACL